MRVSGIIPAERAQKRKDMVGNEREHFARFEMLEARPAEILITTPARVLPFWKYASVHRPPQTVRLRFLEGVQIVEHLICRRQTRLESASAAHTRVRMLRKRGVARQS